MGLQIRTTVNGQQQYIDLYESENVSIDVSFAEIQDITKKNSAYTQEFKVPGTNNNNAIFNYFFEINSTFVDWNPKQAFPAALVYDGYELFTGNIRLNAVTIIIKEKTYSITFYSAIGDLASNIGDKALCNVDTSSLNHSLYLEGVASTLFSDPSLHPVDYIETHSTQAYKDYLNYARDGWNGVVAKGDVQYTLGQRGYDYTGTTYGTIRDINTSQTPVLEFSGINGFFDFQFTPMISSYFIPSIRVRTLYGLIVNQAGYNIESDFFDTDYFGRYYLPLSFNTEQPYMAQAKPYVLDIVNTSGSTFGGNLFTVENLFPSTISTEYAFYPKVVVVDNLGFNPISSANTSTLSWQNISGTTQTPYLIQIPSPVNNIQKVRLIVNWVWTGTPYNDTTIQGYANVWSAKGVDGITGNWYGQILGSVTMFADESTGYFDGITYVDVDITYDSGSEFFVSVSNLGVDSRVTSVEFITTNEVVQLPYTIELYKEMDCTQKQIEYIQNINKMFNLVVVQHPIKPKTLIIEPIVDYIGKGRQLDWTDKVDYNSPQTLRPTTSIINGSLFVANKQDKDFVNTQYNTKTNKIFGQNIIDLGVDYKNSTINLTQSLGQNTDYYLYVMGDTYPALPCYFVLKQGSQNGTPTFEYRPFRSLPRVIFKSVPIPSGNTGEGPIYYRYGGNSNPFTVVGFTALGDLPNVNRLTTYPFAISGFSHYTTYDSSAVFTQDELFYGDVDTQYDRYYRDYIEDLISTENKIYNCKMYLTPWDVSQLYSNEVIFVKNAKFRINKITGLSLTDPSLCNVELVKLTRDYTPTPTLFYDLISCDNNCNIIHSNTDINYLLWAFASPNPATTGTTEGRVVQLTTNFNLTGNTTGRYKIIQTQYNPDYTYENVYFTNDRTIGGTNPNDYYIEWNYKMYESCASTGVTHTLDVVGSIIESAVCECVTMNVTNTQNQRATFTFTNCSGTTSSWTLDVNESISVCGCYGSFAPTGFTYCPSLSTASCTETPLPTPTPTVTPGLSPTPTSTPEGTPTQTPSNTPSHTPTPSNTRSQSCHRQIQINVTDTGWIKYQLCGGFTEYVFLSSLGPDSSNECIVDGTLLPGTPYADVAAFTITNIGISC